MMYDISRVSKEQGDFCPTCAGMGEVAFGKADIAICPSCKGTGQRGTTITKHIPQPTMDLKK